MGCKPCNQRHRHDFHSTSGYWPVGDELFTEEEKNGLAQLAKKYDLIATGGSDYHGLDDSAETMLGGTYVPKESAEQLIALAQSRALKPASS